MTNEPIKLEVCENAEWLLNFGPLSGMVHEDADKDACQFFCSELHSELTALGFETTRPKGQRILCHGWNGYHGYTHKIGPVGTFRVLTDEQENSIIDTIVNCATKTIAKFPAE